MIQLPPETDTARANEDAPDSDDSDPSSADILHIQKVLDDTEPSQSREGFFDRLKYLFTGHRKNDNGLREAIEEYIEEPESFNTDSVSTHERVLLSNILNLRDVKVLDVMIPRADIKSLDIATEEQELFAILAEQQCSRYPVYDGTLDDVLGTIHIKDIVTAISQKKDIKLRDMVTEIPIVSPSLPILDLLLKMRHTRRHMALVVDEFGGIDGLVTIGDVLESIIGEIDDEHDNEDNEARMIVERDGSVLADARVDIDDFEELHGQILNNNEREESDTLGGLVFDVAGRVPARGEVISHSSGMEFEIVEADPRRISKIKIRNIPENAHSEEDNA